jgi:branched-chain amino acid transport system substrate-binding protein
MPCGVRTALACAVAALALALTACGDDAPAGAPEGSRTLTIYSSLPLHGPSRRQSEDMVDAYKLALKRSGGRIGQLTVNYVSLDASEADKGEWTSDKVLDNARQAVRDPNAIAYLGELDSAATALSLPLLNEAGVLQISPSSTYVGLTRGGTGRKGEPERFYPAQRRTFGRVVPPDDVQATALLAYMRAEGVRRVFLLHDRDLYGSGLAEQVSRAAGRAGVAVLGGDGIDGDDDDFSGPARRVAESGADAFFYGGSSEPGSARLFEAIAAEAPRMALFGGDALAERAFTTDLPAAVQRRMHLTSPALPPRLLPRSGRAFGPDFRRRFGRAPEPYAIYAYEAMSAALDAIRRAGRQGNKRPAVVESFFGLRNRPSVLGRYSIDAAGDTSLRTYAGRRVRGSRLVFDKVLDVRR